MDEPVVAPALLNGARATTQWMNLGWWTTATTYPAAGEALARAVGAMAGLRPGDRVIDVGCGAGDSLALWIHAFGVAQVTGIEPNPTLAAAATARVAAWGLSDRITVRQARAEDCVDTADWSGVTAIVSVDATYHLATRATWLRAVASACAPGTRFGCLDLALHAPQDRLRIAPIAARVGIPRDNLWTLDEIAPTLAAIGFTLRTLRPCGDEVLRGFSRFVARHALRFAAHPRAGGWRALATALLLTHTRRRLDAVLIGAERAAAQM